MNSEYSRNHETVEADEFDFNEVEFDLTDNEGSLEYRGLNVVYYTDAEADHTTGKDHPAIFQFTPDTYGNGVSVMIWIWEGVPQKFKPALLIHELCEAYEISTGSTSRDEQAHDTAVKNHMEYAKQKLSAKDYDEFVNWQKDLLENI